MKRCHVYGLGGALVDTEINVTEADIATVRAKKNLMTLINEERRIELYDLLRHRLAYKKRSGGASAANTMVAISQFGAETFYSCKVGNDDNGYFYLNDLQASGVNVNVEKCCADGVTGTCLVMITPDAERTLNTCLGVSISLSPDDLVPETIAASEYLYCETYSFSTPMMHASLIRAKEVARNNNVKIVISFSDPSVVMECRDKLSDFMSDGVDLVFCNRLEALHWAQTDSLNVAADKLKTLARTFVITLGAEGAVAYDGTQLHTIAAYKVKAVDTTGAGDMFAGAFLYCLIQGKDFPTAGKFASFAAARIVSVYGSRLSLGKQQEILSQWNDKEFSWI